MGPSLHIWEEGIVKTVDWKGRIGSKEGKDSFIYWQGHGISFMERAWTNFHRLFSKRKNSQQWVLCKLIAVFELCRPANLSKWKIVAHKIHINLEVGFSFFTAIFWHRKRNKVLAFQLNIVNFFRWKFFYDFQNFLLVS